MSLFGGWIATRSDGPSATLRGRALRAAARACAGTLITDRALDDRGFLQRELAPGLTADELHEVTAALLRIARGVR